MQILTNSFARIPGRFLLFSTVLFSAFWFTLEFLSWSVADCKIPYDFYFTSRFYALPLGFVVAVVQTLGLARAGIFRDLLRYFQLNDIVEMFLSLFVTTMAMVFVSFVPVIDGLVAHIRFALCVDIAVSLVFVVYLRYQMRLFWESRSRGNSGDDVRVAIFGAGDAGSELCEQLLSRPQLRRVPVVFFDDDPKKKGYSVNNVPVAGALKDLVKSAEQYHFDELIIALPTAKRSRIRELSEMAMLAGIKAQLVPSIDEIASGRATVSSLRDVQIEDLLERPQTRLDNDSIREMIAGRVVLVTGAGGSIGSEICEQTARCTPARLILVERCEALMFQVEQNLIAAGFKNIIVPVIADITDAVRMNSVFEKYRPQIVFHAAAHKHVPLMERQPAEALKNNSLGSMSVFELCAEYEVAKCVMISTDKAINPTNAMGASKRLAEIMMQAFAGTQTKTDFMAVRFGNVLGSSGSVVQTFKKQLENGGPLTVTSPEIKRYFMTIPEAVGLVLQTSVIGKNGSIYVLKMGVPVKIVDVARKMIELAGMRPDKDIKIEFVGLRPGEKLFEELKTAGEEFEPSGHDRIVRFKSKPLNAEQLKALRERILEISKHSVRNEIKLAVAELVPEYTPFLD